MLEADLHAREQTLIEVNLEDMLQSLGWQNSLIARALLSRLLRWPARRFARQVLDYDQGVDAYGLSGGAQRLLSTYIKELCIHGQEHVPKTGPLLILSNHPGMTDTVALFAALPRPDLKILAADRPFLRSLQATSRFLIYISENPDERLAALRETARFLRSGGAVLTFPGGKIEPDPAILPGDGSYLDAWSDSIGVFIRMVPELKILPVVVSGVIAPGARRHALTYLRRKPADRERLAATLQILAKIFFPNAWPLTVRVDIYPPLSAGDFAVLHNPGEITRAVIDRVRPYYSRRKNPSST